jgi:hypothetical protein
MATKPKVKNPSRTRLTTILREAAFDPRKPGPLKIVADNSSVDYLELRAIEAVEQARQSVSDSLLTPEEQTEEYESLMKQAMGLLALSYARRSDARQ